MLSQADYERPVTRRTLPMKNRHEARKIIGPETQAGLLYRLSGSICDLRLGKERTVVADQDPRCREFPALVIGKARNARSPHPGRLGEQCNRWFQINVLI